MAAILEAVKKIEYVMSFYAPFMTAVRYVSRPNGPSCHEGSIGFGSEVGSN